MSPRARRLRTIAILVVVAIGVRYCWRSYVISRPVKERVEVVLSNGKERRTGSVNVETQFVSGFPDSTGSIEGSLWPVQIEVAEDKVLYVTDLPVLVPDHVGERIHLSNNGVERRNYAIGHYLNTTFVVCRRGRRVGQTGRCPSLMYFGDPHNRNTAAVLPAAEVANFLGEGWVVETVSVTLNDDPISTPAITDLPWLPTKPEAVTQELQSIAYHTALCLAWVRGKNPFCAEFDANAPQRKLPPRDDLL